MPASEPMEPPFSTAPVEELLRLVSKAARAHQLYLPNNPIYRGAIDGASRRASRRSGRRPTSWFSRSTRPRSRWYDAAWPERRRGAKSPDNLAWLFYKDGIRELKLVKGFEEAEVVAFLAIVQRARKGAPDEDDLVTMLWEADFSLLNYKYVDLLQDGGTGGELADGSAIGGGPAQLGRNTARHAGSRRGIARRPASSPWRTSTRRSTSSTIAKSSISTRRSRANISKTFARTSPRHCSTSSRRRPIRRCAPKCSNIVHTLMVFLLTAAHFRGVAFLLRESRAALQRSVDVVSPISANDCAALADQSERARRALAIAAGARRGAVAAARKPSWQSCSTSCDPAALGTVFSWLGKSGNDRLRPLLEAAAGRLAAANTAELVRLIQAPEPEVSSEAIRRAGALKAQAAVLALGKMLTEPYCRASAHRGAGANGNRIGRCACRRSSV